GDDLDILPNKVGGHVGQPGVITFGVAVIDRQVAALDIADLLETGAKISDLIEHHQLQQRDPPRLLCTGSERQGGSAAGHRGEIASPHSIPSSARARIDGGTVRPSALAAFRLMTSSNWAGCSTGTSDGSAPPRTLPTMRAAWR